MVQRQNCHRTVDALVSKRQSAGSRVDRRNPMRRSLGGHHVAWLDRDHMTVGGFVGASSRADIHDGLGAAERCVDPSPELRILTSGPRVTMPDVLVARLAFAWLNRHAGIFHHDATRGGLRPAPSVRTVTPLPLES